MESTVYTLDSDYVKELIEIGKKWIKPREGVLLNPGVEEKLADQFRTLDNPNPLGRLCGLRVYIATWMKPDEIVVGDEKVIRVLLELGSFAPERAHELLTSLVSRSSFGPSRDLTEHEWRQEYECVFDLPEKESP